MDPITKAENDLMSYDEAFENNRFVEAQAAAQAAQAEAMIAIAQELRKLNERADLEAERAERTVYLRPTD